MFVIAKKRAITLPKTSENITGLGQTDLHFPHWSNNAMGIANQPRVISPQSIAFPLHQRTFYFKNLWIHLNQFKHVIAWIDAEREDVVCAHAHPQITFPPSSPPPSATAASFCRTGVLYSAMSVHQKRRHNQWDQSFLPLSLHHVCAYFPKTVLEG